MKYLLGFGISNPKLRLAVWCGACVASSVLLIFWWPLGAIPFALLLARSLWVAKKVIL